MQGYLLLLNADHINNNIKDNLIRKFKKASALTPWHALTYLLDNHQQKNQKEIRKDCPLPHELLNEARTALRDSDKDLLLAMVSYETANEEVFPSILFAEDVKMLYY
jgi:hypothetical protein